MSQPRRVPRHTGIKLILLALVCYFLLPVWWLVVASTKNAKGLFSGSGALWFNGFHLFDNLGDLFSYNNGEYLRWMWNSVLYAGAGGIGCTIVSVLAGYGFAMYKFTGRTVFFGSVLGAVMVPLTALVIPTFVMFSNAGLTDTIWAVILPSLLSPFAVYLMRVYAGGSIPEELVDAARVDGAGELRIFFQVALPLMRPGVITVLLLSVVSTWNNYFLPLTMLSTSKLYPLTVGINLWETLATSNNGSGQSLWNLIIVGSLLSTLPLIIAFLSLQRYWQGGLTVGSLK
ncbi:carbohydrate ABC transporter permease [Kineosporia sp. J2-2]|uniref:Carbohydrate ABC transporter permease n=1 Tax=Kineosporia corallincola TaxID=2835133 RepID=A0ABS5TNB1_9ACTN|nr:carbohydrate ABC transporter permease [Kineosporia corallincola]MBT0772581.1 carbohydrate ABC transporter permease [Kineosporia corallincola]